jgi:GNAT superfamily N-acetyltransferase
VSAATFTIRSAREDDLDAIVDLKNEAAMRDVGTAVTSRGDMLRFWRTYSVDPSRDAWVAVHPDGRVIGSGEVILDENDDDLWVEVGVHPLFRGRRIGGRLADLAEARASEMAASRGRSLPAEVIQGAWSNSDESRFLEARGYEWIRCFLRMRADLSEPPEKPVWPDGIELAGFERGRDEAAFHACLDEGFRDHWRWTHTPLEEFVRLLIENDEDFDGSLWFRAVEGDTTVGAIVCVPRASEEEGAGWIEDLAVLRPWRKRGIALALLLHALGALHRRGLRAALLGVDADSPTGAKRLYERAGMREVRRTDLYSKRIG